MTSRDQSQIVSFLPPALKKLALSTALCSLLTGCPDPQGALDDFGVRYNEANAGGSEGGPNLGDCTPAQADSFASSEFLTALSVKLSPKTPVTLLAKLTTAADGPGVSVSMNLQYLSREDQTTPVGEPFDRGPYAVAEDGTFTADWETIVVPIDANAVNGFEITANVGLVGNAFCKDTTLICGDVTGATTSPVQLDLAGSTFTMQPIVSGTLPEIVINCEGDAAAF